MKKISLFITLILSIFAMGTVNAAASYSLSSSSSTITNGSKVVFTVKLYNTAAWSIKGSSSGATSGCSISSADSTSDGKDSTKVLTATCVATDIGQIGFTVSGDITSASSGTVKVSKSVSVNVTKARDPDSNNYLGSLVVSGYDLTPDFSKDTSEYSVTVPSSVNSVTIDATAASQYADIVGTGSFDVSEGLNALKVTVTSETGVQRVYTVNVTVEDLNPINITIDGKSYSIMKNLKTVVAPEGFTASTITINDIEVPDLVNESLGITLVGVRDESGNVFLALYKDGTYTLFNQNESTGLILYILKISDVLDGFTKSSVTINGDSYDSLVLNLNNSLVLVYAENMETGVANYYVYDSSNNTFTLYDSSILGMYAGKLKQYKYVIFGLGILSVLLFLLNIVSVISGRKHKKNKHEVNPIKPVTSINEIGDEEIEHAESTMEEERIKNIEDEENHEEIPDDYQELEEESDDVKVNEISPREQKKIEKEEQKRIKLEAKRDKKNKRLEEKARNDFDF
ncbi:MAG TPA: cadherin-like beta sandwich domain-containing protein [Bacilli bacterium]|nr:cadherin-like beta sandwich domain-containing protein [Bacilli bacterium]HQC83312.1 cadherin-like beta sandwich domain-containing protein [Bacilli bacterium]